MTALTPVADAIEATTYIKTASSEQEIFKILHVDDDPVIQRTTKMLLQDVYGKLEVDNANSVDEALRMTSIKNYDVIISDYEMPGKNGLDLLKELKTGKTSTPFILFTGKGREEVAIQALNIGVDAYINKQGDPETVYGELWHAIQKTIELNKSKKLLKESELRLRNLIENAPYGIYIVDMKGKFIDGNKSARELIGYEKEEVAGKSIYELGLLDQENLARSMKDISSALKGNTTGPTEYELRRRDGKTVQAEISSIVIDLDDGKKEYVGFTKDISECKKIEATLKKTEDRYRELVNGVPEIIFECDLNGIVTFANERTYDQGYYARGTVEGHSILEFVSAEDRHRVAEKTKKILASGTIGFNQYTLLKKDGTPYPALIKTSPINCEGQHTGLRGIVIDITERKNAEERLKASERSLEEAEEAQATAEKQVRNSQIQLNIFLENCVVPAFIINDEGTHVYVNQSATKLLGYTTEELLKMHFSKLLFKEDLQEKMGNFAKLREIGSFREEVELKCKNGDSVLVDLNAVKLPNKTLIGFCDDITEKRKLQEELQTKYESLEKVAESMDAGLVILGKDYRVIWSNSKLRKRGFLPNQKCFQAVDRTDTCPDCGIKKILEQNLPREVHDYKHVKSSSWSQLRSTPLKDKNGNITAVLELEIPITERKKTEELLKETNQVVNSIINSTEDVIYAVDEKFNFIYANEALAKIVGCSPDKMIRENLWSFFPNCANTKLEENLRKALERKEKQTFVWQGIYNKRYQEFTIFPFERGIAVFAKDITEQKKAQSEIEREQVKLHVANEKLKVVGSLTRHDVKNQNSAIKAHVYLLKKLVGANPALRQHLEGIESAVNQSERIFEFSRMYEQIGAEEPSKVDVGESFAEAIKLQSESSKLSFANDCKGLQVTADSMLRQLFYNLIDNSLKHGQKVTQVKLRYQRNKDAIKIIYEDNGAGIAKENKNRIFSGFTTGGSGLGLKLVKKMIEAYGWSIEENGVPEKGARFEIAIPC